MRIAAREQRHDMPPLRGHHQLLAISRDGETFAREGDLWTAKIIADKPFRLATVAMANKAARSIWAMLTKKQEYRQPAF